MKKQTSILIAILIPLVLLIVVLVFFLVKNSTDSYLTSLPIERYVDTPKSFAGNIYSLNATIDSQLAFVENKGRIILLKTSENRSIPIYILASREGFNPMLDKNIYSMSA